MRASCDRIDIDKQKTISQTLRFPYNARVYIMRASYDSIDNKQKMCEKVNKDITFIQFFHYTRLHSTAIFSLLTLQPLFCKKLVGREKIYVTYMLLKAHTFTGETQTAIKFVLQAAEDYGNIDVQKAALGLIIGVVCGPYRANASNLSLVCRCLSLSLSLSIYLYLSFSLSLSLSVSPTPSRILYCYLSVVKRNARNSRYNFKILKIFQLLRSNFCLLSR